MESMARIIKAEKRTVYLLFILALAVVAFLVKREDFELTSPAISRNLRSSAEVQATSDWKNNYDDDDDVMMEVSIIRSSDGCKRQVRLYYIIPFAFLNIFTI